MSEIDAERALARALLYSARRVAVLGAHAARHKPAFFVPDYLNARGYDLRPVNPTLTGRRLWGQPVVARLDDVTEPIDLLLVFRRAAHLPAHLPEILALDPAPGGVWLPLGVRHDGFVAALRGADIPVVQDRCALVDHRRFGLPSAGAA